MSLFRFSPFPFFYNDPAPTEIYTLSLHDALPISRPSSGRYLAREVPLTQRGLDLGSSRGVARPPGIRPTGFARARTGRRRSAGDRKSTRLNSSHVEISYAVFCLKKKKKK